MTKTFTNTLEFGYWFHPPVSEHAPGSNRVDIVLHTGLAGEYFTPQWLSLPVKSDDDTISIVKIHHPWLSEQTYQVCAGLIEIDDGEGEKVEAFTLGGSLKIEPHVNYTYCTLESPAPILEFNRADPELDFFIEEIEILLAKRRAALLSESLDHETRLISANPLELYCAILNALIDKFNHSHHKSDSQIHELINFLHAERQRLMNEDLLPPDVPPLENLL